MNITTALRESIDIALAVDGGFTFDPRTETFIRPGDPTMPVPKGYAIAIPDTESDDLEELAAKAEVASFVNGRDAFIGGWRDANGKLWLELSEIHDIPEPDARLIGKRRKQLAILEMATGKELWI